MRTTIGIDEQLLEEAMRVAGIWTKREVVHKGVRLLVRLHSQSKLEGLRGTVSLDIDPDAGVLSS